MKKNKKQRLILFIRIFGLSIVSTFLVYLITKQVFKWHFCRWGDKLITLEKQGKLSKDYDIWKIELQGDTMDSMARDITTKPDSLHIKTYTPIDSVIAEN